jgi:hypothetical protein
MQKTQHTFYPKLINRTSVQLSHNETQLLNKGPNYNLHYTSRKWIETLAIEAETAISNVEENKQNHLRHVVANAIKAIIKRKETKSHTQHIPEWKTLMSIKRKLEEHKAILTQADKGKTIVIISEEEYNKHIMNFIDENQFSKISSNPTNSYQNNVKRVIKSCKYSIPKSKQWIYYHMNPQPPNIRAQIKIHKTPNTIRPIVNWRNAPGYKLAKELTRILQQNLQLPYTYNISNTVQLTTDLNSIPINENTRMCSFDIKNMYTNIPTAKVYEYIKQILNKTVEMPNRKTEILNLVKTVLDQNYFSFNNEFYTQDSGLAMGAPSSAILAEVFLQEVEHNEIYTILKKYNIEGYFRYVDDILIIYDSQSTNIANMLIEFNNIHKNIQYTREDETNNSINFLDITIHRTASKLTYGIYRKPTTTDTMIHQTSCHPQQHKMSGIRYLAHRLHTYPMDKNEMKKESDIIKQMLTNNSYKINNHIIQSIHNNKKTTATPRQDHKKEKWAVFTYQGPETQKGYQDFQRHTTQNSIQD